MKFVDTNVFIRYLTRDDEAKAQACFDLFQRVRSGLEEITTSEANITKIVYMLSARAHYRLPHETVGALLRPLLLLKGFKLMHKRVYLRALDSYVAHPTLDYEDALVAAHMERRKVQTVYSYDTDFDRLPQISREEPPIAQDQDQ